MGADDRRTGPRHRERKALGEQAAAAIADATRVVDRSLSVSSAMIPCAMPLAEEGWDKLLGRAGLTNLPLLLG